MKEGRSATGFQIRSFTCADLEATDLVQGRSGDRRLKQSISDGLHRATSHPDGKLSKSGGTSKQNKKDQGARKKSLNVASISNIGSQQKNQTVLTSGTQDGGPLRVSLPANLDWVGADQEDIAEIGTPHHTNDKIARKRTLG